MSESDALSGVHAQILDIVRRARGIRSYKSATISIKDPAKIVRGAVAAAADPKSDTKQILKEAAVPVKFRWSSGDPDVRAISMPVWRVTINLQSAVLVPETPTLEQTSRPLREFGSRNFLRVTFALPADSPFPTPKDRAVAGRYIRDGFYLAGRYWMYLAQSSGQLKEQQMWFCAAPEPREGGKYCGALDILPSHSVTFCEAEKVMDQARKQSLQFFEHRLPSAFLVAYAGQVLKPATVQFIATVRAWLGDFSTISNPSKLMTRRGMCFGKSFPALEIPEGEVEIQPDHSCTDPETGAEYVYTDGCGEISTELMRAVCQGIRSLGVVQKEEQLSGAAMPSALQIRFGGSKGMLVLNPQLEGRRIILRESMVKFQIPHPTATQRTLEVLSTSVARLGHLNHQVIAILEDRGVQPLVFKEILEPQLNEMIQPASDPEASRALLLRNRRSPEGRDIMRMILAGVPHTDVCFRMRFKQLQLTALQSLKRKFRIPITNSASVIGVYDFTRSLKPNQVALSISGAYAGQFGFHTSTADIPIVRRVAIAKNPCLHPGDIQVFEAVEHPILSEIPNVVFFPVDTGGRAPPDMLGGADLDGDMYLVIWDDRLTNLCDFPPSDFPPLPPLPPMGGADSGTQLSMEERSYRWLVKSLFDNDLGMLGNKHKIVSDLFGLSSPFALDLAREFYYLVDADKTGYVWRGASGPMESLLRPKDIGVVGARSRPLKPHFMAADRIAEGRKGSLSNTLFYMSRRAAGVMFDMILTAELKTFLSFVPSADNITLPPALQGCKTERVGLPENAVRENMLLARSMQLQYARISVDIMKKASTPKMINEHFTTLRANLRDALTHETNLHDSKIATDDTRRARAIAFLRVCYDEARKKIQESEEGQVEKAFKAERRRPPPPTEATPAPKRPAAAPSEPMWKSGDPALNFFSAPVVGARALYGIYRPRVFSLTRTFANSLQGGGPLPSKLADGTGLLAEPHIWAKKLPESPTNFPGRPPNSRFRFGREKPPASTPDGTTEKNVAPAQYSPLLFSAFVSASHPPNISFLHRKWRLSFPAPTALRFALPAASAPCEPEAAASQEDASTPQGDGDHWPQPSAAESRPAHKELISPAVVREGEDTTTEVEGDVLRVRTPGATEEYKLLRPSLNREGILFVPDGTPVEQYFVAQTNSRRALSFINLAWETAFPELCAVFARMNAPPDLLFQGSFAPDMIGAITFSAKHKFVAPK